MTVTSWSDATSFVVVDNSSDAHELAFRLGRGLALGLRSALVWRFRIGVSVAFIVAISGCGPSEEARFDEAIAQARTALSEDRLDEAEVSLRDAEALRPTAPAVRQGLDDLAAIRASRDTFVRAEAMVGTGALLEARRLFQTVAPVDRVRYSQARQYVAELEQEWVDQFGDELDQLLIDVDPGELLRAIRDARAVLPGSGLVEVAIQSRGERALTAAADAATELVQEDLAAAERLLDAIGALFMSQRFEVPASFVAATELVAQEKARVEQQRIQEWQAAQRETARPPRPSTGVVPVPRVPTFQIPEQRCRPNFSNPNWQEEFWRCEGVDFGPSPSPSRPSPIAPIAPVQPVTPVVQCPIPRARIVLTSLDVNIQHDGGLAIFATLTTSMSGYVENLSTGLLGATVMYEFINAKNTQAFGVVTWTDGTSLINPGGRRNFVVANNSSPVNSTPTSLRVYLVGPTLVAPTLELSAQCPPQTPAVTDAFGSYTTPLNFR